MRSGDWGNLFILANSGLFLASVILQNAENYLQGNERGERNESVDATGVICGERTVTLKPPEPSDHASN